MLSGRGSIHGGLRLSCLRRGPSHDGWVAARRDLPRELSARPFSVQRALELGVTAGRLRAGDLASPFSGTRIPRGLDADLRTRCVALTTRFGVDHAFAGATAARLWGIPLPRRLEMPGPLHVSTPRGVRAMRRAGVVGSERASDAVVRVRDGLPVVDPASCWRQLGRVLAVHDLVAAADFLVTGTLGRGALLSLTELRHTVEAAAGSPGTPALREALGEVRVGAWSRPESLFRLLVTRAGIPEPTLNRPLILADGGVVRPDFAWLDWAVAAEYDGRYHADPRQWSADLSRTERVVDSGIALLHVTATDLYLRQDELVRRVARRLHAAGWTPGAAIDPTTSARFVP
jgi:hypothetical protein